MQKLRQLDGIGLVSFFFALVSFVLGAYLAFDFHSPSCVLIFLSIIPFLYAAFKRGKGNVVVFLLSLGLGIGLFSIKIPPQEGKGTYEGFVLEARANYFFFVSKGVRYYVVEKESTREKGDVLSIEGKAAPYEGTEYESRFSFKEYLAKNGISDQLSAYKITVKFQLPLRLRAKEVSFLSHFSKEGADAIDALLFNHKDYSSSFIQKASSLGCLYFLSLSGLLYGGVLQGSEKLLSLKLKDKQTHAICWVLALLLLPFGLGKAGFWRVFLSRSYHLYAERKGLRSPPHFYVLSILGIVSLLLNRYYALDSGFLLGYGLSFALCLTRGVLSRYPGKKKSLMTSLFVLFFLFPMLANKGALHLLSLFYSFLLMPLVYPFAFFSSLSFLTLPWVKFLNAYAHVIVGVVDVFEKVDLLIPLGNWSGPFTIGYYFFFGAFYYFREFNARLIERLLLGALSGVIGLGVLPISNAVSGEVSFINVGQGDAILIRDRFTTVLIDTGGSLSFDLAEEVDIPYLRKNRIYKIDYLIASHGDYDHIGAAASLSQHFHVSHYVTDKNSFPLKAGDLTFVNYNLWGGAEENEESLVLGLDFLGKEWLFTGDAPISIEKKILQEFPAINCDILKVGHHGSKTSSSYDFLKTITPEVAIISVGRKNKYGHPNEEVIERLTSLGIPIRRTDEEGTITYETYFRAKLGRVSS